MLRPLAPKNRNEIALLTNAPKRGEIDKRIFKRWDFFSGFDLFPCPILLVKFRGVPVNTAWQPIWGIFCGGRQWQVSEWFRHVFAPLRRVFKWFRQANISFRHVLEPFCWVFKWFCWVLGPFRRVFEWFCWVFKSFRRVFKWIWHESKRFWWVFKSFQHTNISFCWVFKSFCRCWNGSDTRLNGSDKCRNDLNTPLSHSGERLSRSNLNLNGSVISRFHSRTKLSHSFRKLFRPRTNYVTYGQNYLSYGQNYPAHL